MVSPYLYLRLAVEILTEYVMYYTTILLRVSVYQAMQMSTISSKSKSLPTSVSISISLSSSVSTSTSSSMSIFTLPPLLLHLECVVRLTALGTESGGLGALRSQA